MKAKITFFVGSAVLLLGLTQLALTQEPIRAFTVAVGAFFMLWGWKIGWTRHRGLTLWLGHAALVAGVWATVHGATRLPFLQRPPTWLEILDLPLFWGLFTILGGMCMIRHGHCACCVASHEARTNARCHRPPAGTPGES